MVCHGTLPIFEARPLYRDMQPEEPFREQDPTTMDRRDTYLTVVIQRNVSQSRRVTEKFHEMRGKFLSEVVVGDIREPEYKMGEAVEH